MSEFTDRRYKEIHARSLSIELNNIEKCKCYLDARTINALIDNKMLTDETKEMLKILHESINGNPPANVQEEEKPRRYFVGVSSENFNDGSRCLGLSNDGFIYYEHQSK